MGRSWPSSFSITPAKGDYGGCADGSVGYFEPLEVQRAKHAMSERSGDRRSWVQIYHLHMVLCYRPLYCVSYPPCWKKSPTLPLYFLLTKIYFVSIPSANKQIKYGTHATFNNTTNIGFFYHKISWSLLGVTCYVQAKNTFTKCKHLNHGALYTWSGHWFYLTSNLYLWSGFLVWRQGAYSTP